MTFRHRFAYLLAAAAVLACGTSAVAQQNRGTPEQQAACASDAFRLCSSYIPDPTEVAGCLRQRRQELSGSCRSVFEQAEGAAETSIRSRRTTRDY